MEAVGELLSRKKYGNLKVATEVDIDHKSDTIQPKALYTDPSPIRKLQLFGDNGFLTQGDVVQSFYPVDVAYVDEESLIIRSSMIGKDEIGANDYTQIATFFLLNDSSIFVNFKDSASKQVIQTEFKLKLAKEPEKLQRRDSSGSMLVTKDVWQFTYRFELENEAPLDFTDEETGEINIPEDLPVINNTLEDFLLDFNPYFTSQIHLILHLIQLQIKDKIGKALQGVEATKVYQEITYDSYYLDYAPQVDSDYRKTAVRRMLGKDTTDSFYHYIQLGTLYVFLLF